MLYLFSRRKQMTSVSTSTLNYYWEKEAWSGSDNILKLIQNYKRDVDYFNHVNINSPFCCFSGIIKQSFSTRKMGKSETVENIQMREASKTRKEGREGCEKQLQSLGYGLNKARRFEKRRIFKAENKKRGNIFGIRQIKGVMFKESKRKTTGKFT